MAKEVRSNFVPEGGRNSGGSSRKKKRRRRFNRANANNKPPSVRSDSLEDDDEDNSNGGFVVSAATPAMTTVSLPPEKKVNPHLASGRAGSVKSVVIDPYGPMSGNFAVPPANGDGHCAYHYGSVPRRGTHLGLDLNV